MLKDWTNKSKAKLEPETLFCQACGEQNGTTGMETVCKSLYQYMKSQTT